jgi:hypothetical protein
VLLPYVSKPVGLHVDSKADISSTAASITYLNVNQNGEEKVDGPVGAKGASSQGI